MHQYDPSVRHLVSWLAQVKNGVVSWSASKDKKYIYIYIFISVDVFQLIQTVTALDPDEPLGGQHFYYSLAPEAANNPNFTLRDNQGKRPVQIFRHVVLLQWDIKIFNLICTPREPDYLRQPFPHLFDRFQITRRGSWRVVEAGHSRTSLSSTCPSSSPTASSQSKPARARWPYACAAATRRAMSWRATPKPTASLPASAEEPSLPSSPVSSSYWVSYDLLPQCCAERSQWPFVMKWNIIWYSVS